MPLSSPTPNRLISVIIRNGISIIGVLLLGWSAERMALLYFADTLAGIWAVLTAILFFQLTHESANWGDRVYNGASAALGALFIIAIIALPLGLPLLFMIQWKWKTVLIIIEQADFIKALLGISITNILLSFRLYYQEVKQEKGIAFQSPVNRHFAVLFTRWIVIIIFIYITSLLLKDFTKYFCVIIYALATIYSELFPDKFANLIPQKRGRK